MYYYCEVRIHNHTGARESLCIFHNKKENENTDNYRSNR